MSHPDPHHAAGKPSSWIARFAHLIAPGASLLDIAAGGGRHARYFLERGARVTCIDRDVSALADLAGRADVEIVTADLETGAPFPLAGRRFDAVVVVHYLWRPILGALVDAVAPGGALLYDTFMLGNERFGPPRNPDHLLRPGELLEAVAGKLEVAAYEAGEDRASLGPTMVQRICAVRGGEARLAPR